MPDKPAHPDQSVVETEFQDPAELAAMAAAARAAGPKTTAEEKTEEYRVLGTVIHRQPRRAEET